MTTSTANYTVTVNGVVSTVNASDELTAVKAVVLQQAIRIPAAYNLAGAVAWLLATKELNVTVVVKA